MASITEDLRNLFLDLDVILLYTIFIQASLISMVTVGALTSYRDILIIAGVLLLIKWVIKKFLKKWQKGNPVLLQAVFFFLVALILAVYIYQTFKPPVPQ